MSATFTDTSSSSSLSIAWSVLYKRFYKVRTFPVRSFCLHSTYFWVHEASYQWPTILFFSPCEHRILKGQHLMMRNSSKFSFFNRTLFGGGYFEKPRQVLQQFLQVEKFQPSCIAPCETRCFGCGYASWLSQLVSLWLKACGTSAVECMPMVFEGNECTLVMASVFCGDQWLKLIGKQPYICALLITPVTKSLGSWLSLALNGASLWCNVQPDGGNCEP